MFFWMQPSDKEVSCLFAASAFPLVKGMRRNEKESSFLKDLAEILKTGTTGVGSRSSRMVFLLHHLVKEQKTWDTHYFIPKKMKTPAAHMAGNGILLSQTSFGAADFALAHDML